MKLMFSHQRNVIVVCKDLIESVSGFTAAELSFFQILAFCDDIEFEELVGRYFENFLSFDNFPHLPVLTSDIRNPYEARLSIRVKRKGGRVTQSVYSGPPG